MNCIIIAIAGGTASGKTTIAEKIYAETSKHGSVSLIIMDDYYKNFNHLPFEERTKINYDHPQSYDIELFIDHLEQLKNGKTISKPIYDFVEHKRRDETEEVAPANVIIIEGIMLFAIPDLLKYYDIKVFVDTDDDIRFIRRLKRDTEYRGRTVDNVINQYLETVRPMHLQFVEPSKRYADIIIPEGGHNTVAIDILNTKIVNILLEQQEA